MLLLLAFALPIGIEEANDTVVRAPDPGEIDRNTGGHSGARLDG